MLIRRAAALVVLALAVSACGGGDDDGGGDGVRSGQDVADLIGCTGFAGDSEEMFVTEGGGCELEGEDVTVYYFAEQEALGNYLDVAGSFGGQYLTGDNWAVGASPAVLKDLQAEVGGDITGD